MIDILIHLILLIFLPPFLLGVINKTKAFFAGRKGAPVLQLYFDIIKYMRKSVVQSSTTTWIFRAGPIVTLVTVFIAGLLVPQGRFNAPVSFLGDMIFFAYLFGLARFFTTAAALDTGSAFEGMGAAREVTFACISEPTLFFAFLVLSKLSGSFLLGTMLHNHVNGLTMEATAPLVLIAIGLFIYLLAETCRIPVDDPNTHLELTMIHEVMVLDHSGPLFGIISYAASLKLFILGSVFISVIAPFQTGNAFLDRVLFIVEMLGLSVIIGAVESVMARLSMKRVPYLLVVALLLCGSAFILLWRLF